MGRFFTLRYKSGATVAAPAITYGSSDVTWYDGVPITPLTVTNTGGAVTSYSVDPALPAGISLNTSTGEISGTPTALDADDTYTITATGPTGLTDTFDLTAEVLASLLTGLVAYWNLDEASGTREDSHTNGLDLTDNNTVGSGLGVGDEGVAADFVSANSEYLSRAHSAAMTLGGSWEFGFWLYTTYTSGFNGLLAKGNPESSGGEMECYIQNTAGRIADLGVRRSDDSTYSRNSEPTNLADGTWRYVSLYHDADNDILGIAINAGTPDAQAHTTGVYSGTNALNVGRARTTLYGDKRMQAMGFWGRVLTSAQRTLLYNSGVPVLYDDIAGLY